MTQSYVKVDQNAQNMAYIAFIIIESLTDPKPISIPLTSGHSMHSTPLLSQRSETHKAMNENVLETWQCIKYVKADITVKDASCILTPLPTGLLLPPPAPSPHPQSGLAPTLAPPTPPFRDR